MRILIAEDAFFVAAEIEAVLEGAGHAVVGMTGDGDQAVALAGESRPDLCLMDIQLAKGTSGIDAAKEIFRHYGIASLFVTANPDLIDEAARAVALGCVSKPFRDTTLLAAITLAPQVTAGEEPCNIPSGLALFPKG